MEEPPGFLGGLCAGGEGGIPGFPMGQGAMGLHRGHCPTPKCLWDLHAPSCPNPRKNHLEPLVVVREIEPLPEAPRGTSGELPLNSFPWPGIPSSGPDQQLPWEPWVAGAGPGVSPFPWFWGHSVTSGMIPTLTQGA